MYMCGINNHVFTFLAYPKGLALESLQGLHDTVLFTLLHCCAHTHFS